MADDTPIDRGVEVVAAMARFDPSVADLVDVLEAVLDDPGDIRTVLDRAEAAGYIEREGARIYGTKTALRAESRARIITRDGDFECLRCGRHLSTGYFFRVGETEAGPYGSTCIDRVTGRD